MATTTREPAREPKHFTVRRHLLNIIDSMEPGTAVPTERSLASELGTSRTTVRQALVDLVAEGRLTRRQGSGTYVADAKITWPLELASFTEQAAANNMTASSSVISTARIRADDETADRLDLALGDSVYRIERLRYADGAPIALEVSVLSAERFPGLTRKIRREGSLHALLARDYRVDLRRGEETIDIAPASPREADLLETDPSSPMLVVRRHSFDADRRSVEWGTTWFRGDRITLVAHLKAPRS